MVLPNPSEPVHRLADEVSSPFEGPWVTSSPQSRQLVALSTVPGSAQAAVKRGRPPWVQLRHYWRQTTSLGGSASPIRVRAWRDEHSVTVRPVTDCSVAARSASLWRAPSTNEDR